MRPSNLEILVSEECALGMLSLRRRELSSAPESPVIEISLDHEFLMSSVNTDSERALAHVGIGMHEGESLKVLVGGLGLGYTAREALNSERVESVEVVELLPPVIRWLEQGLVPLSAELTGEGRLFVREGDVYRELAGSPQARYDLILVDVDHSPEERLHEASGNFYTEAGLELAKQHLAPEGVLGVWSYAESPAFARALRRVFRDVRVEPVTFENRVLEEEETNWLFFARD